MKREFKLDKSVLVILIVILILSVFFAWWYLGKEDTSNNKTLNDNVKNENKKESVDDIKIDKENSSNDEKNNYKYAVYNKGDEITLSDNTKWLVIKDSPDNQDYVTVLSSKDYSYLITDDRHNKLFDELYNHNYTNYDNSYLKEFIELQIDTIPVTLKEVNGYKIRLITLEEIFGIDSNWQYNQDDDTYQYTGDELNSYLGNVLTMTSIKTKCNVEKCWPIYKTGSSQCYGDCQLTYFVGHYGVGIGGLKPVINILKDDLK